MVLVRRCRLAASWLLIVAVSMGATACPKDPNEVDATVSFANNLHFHSDYGYFDAAASFALGDILLIDTVAKSVNYVVATDLANGVKVDTGFRKFARADSSRTTVGVDGKISRADSASIAAKVAALVAKSTSLVVSDAERETVAKPASVVSADAATASALDTVLAYCPHCVLAIVSTVIRASEVTIELTDSTGVGSNLDVFKKGTLNINVTFASNVLMSATNVETPHVTDSSSSNAGKSDTSTPKAAQIASVQRDTGSVALKAPRTLRATAFFVPLRLVRTAIGFTVQGLPASASLETYGFNGESAQTDSGQRTIINVLSNESAARARLGHRIHLGVHNQ